MDSLHFRPATNADCAKVKDLVFQTLAEYGLQPAPDSTDADLDDLEGEYAGKGGRFDILETEGGEMVGTVGLYNRGEGEAELRKMYLKSAYRGRGQGKRMLDFALQEAHNLGFQRITLETAEVLRDAIVLYERFGFRPLDCTPQAGRCDSVYFLDL